MPKISDSALPTFTSLTGTELVPMVQGSLTGKASADVFAGALNPALKTAKLSKLQEAVSRTVRVYHGGTSIEAGVASGSHSFLETLKKY